MQLHSDDAALERFCALDDEVATERREVVDQQAHTRLPVERVLDP